MKLKVFGLPWHVGHQYELLKLRKYYDVEFYFLLNNVRRWSQWSARPDDGINWVTSYEPGKYDIAILHLDQQCVNPDIGKGQLYRQLNEVIQDIPKIVINHGTPMYSEMYDEDMVINGGVAYGKSGQKEKILGMKELIDDNFMLVNSYEAVKRWGWGYPIIHGMDADEWFDLPKEPRVVISLSPGGLDKYYNRQLLTYIKAEVREKTGLEVVHTNVNYQVRDWNDYRTLLGTSLIYINPTLDSPMPRSRTEAMLSGCCVLSSRYHNADEFIDHGKNGFIVPDNPISYAMAISQLINNNYREAVKIGERGRKTALKYFNGERYRKDLWHVISEVANGRKPKWGGIKIWD